jgi:hypothetical protein
MYACIPEIGRGFLEGVCTPSNTTAYLREPPPPPLDSPTALFQRCSKSNTGVSVRAFYFLESHQPIGECGLGRVISKRLTMWHMRSSPDVSVISSKKPHPSSTPPKA